MRTRIWHIAVFFAIVALISSCKGGNDIYPSVQLEFVTGQTTDKGLLSAITTDKNKTYLVSKDRTNTVYDANKSVRIVANYAIEAVNADSTADIYASTKAIATIPQTPDKFVNGIKNDPAEVLSIWQGRNYLNIVLNILSQSQSHTFAFIEQSATIESDGRYHVSILLYHDSNNDVKAYTKRAYLSIPLIQYAGTNQKGGIITFSLYTNDGTLKSYVFDYVPQK